MTGPTTSLQEALTREHHEVDAAVEAFVEDQAHGRVDPSGVRQALLALRRHIYLEEEVVFPPIQRAGLVMPVLVMLREHGELWRTMGRLEGLLDSPGGSEESGGTQDLLATCQDLLAQLERHNSKEEPVVYPHVDSDLSADEQTALAELLESGTTPPGWTCQHAAG